MTVPNYTDFELIRGQAIDIEVTVPDEVDLGVATIEFGLSASNKMPYDVTLSTGTSGQVITGSLTSAQSEALEGEVYYFSCWVTISGASTPVARGHISVINDSRSE